MIIRRQLYPTNNAPVNRSHDSGMEMKPIYKTPASQASPVNKLLNTAASGTSIVRDVDTLLTPIHELQHRDEMNYTREQQLLASKERTERNLWRNDEVMEMLYTMQQVNALEKLNDKTVKSENVFKDVEELMRKNGFVKKSHLQIWTKWKFLKSTYMTSRRNRVIPRMVPPQVYETIHQMVSGNNAGLSDGGNSANGSIDGDASSMNGGGSMVISGVESVVTNAANTDDDNFGMAHPIFGFRLGTVKSEPSDTGYDAVENTGSDKDPLDDIEAVLSKTSEIKSDMTNSVNKANTAEPHPQKAAEVPHRGRGRPPKHQPTATSTPNTTSEMNTRNGQMPPLRVAPFAKTSNSANALAANGPPPPLTQPPTPRIHIATLESLKQNEILSNLKHRKILPKPPQAPGVVQQTIRIPKEISIQTRPSTSPSPSYPKMKQIPMRKTPYSLRPDRAIPDLDASLSPPPPPYPTSEKLTAKRFEEVPSTRYLTMQQNNAHNLQNAANRKRRLAWSETFPHQKRTKYVNGLDEHEESANSEHIDDGKHYGKVLQNVIIDLSSSLRKMQTEMMRDFFNKQNELLQKEHEFQLQQDRMIMRAFQEQTHEIMRSVKQLVGTISHHNKNESQNFKNATKINGNARVRSTQKSANMSREQQDIDEDQQSQNDEDNEVEEEQEQEEETEDQQMDQEQEEMYYEGEEKEQDQLDDEEETNDQEQQDESENNDDVEDEEEENNLHEGHQNNEIDDAEDAGENEEEDDDDDSDYQEQDPIQMVTSELTEDEKSVLRF